MEIAHSTPSAEKGETWKWPRYCSQKEFDPLVKNDVNQLAIDLIPMLKDTEETHILSEMIREAMA